MRRMASALVLGLAAAAAGAALAGGLDEVKKKGTLTVLTTPGNEPFEMHDKAGKLIGFDVALAERIRAAAGVAKLEWKEMAFDGMLAALAKGEGDLALSGISVTDERKKQLLFSAPYTEVEKALLLPAGKSGATLAGGSTIAVPEATTSVELAKKTWPKATVRSYKDEGAAAHAVLEGQVDGMLYDAPFLRFVAKKHEAQVHVEPAPALPKESIAVAAAPGNGALIELVNATLAKMKEDGSLAKLEKEWFHDLAWIKDVKDE